MFAPMARAAAAPPDTSVPFPGVKFEPGKTVQIDDPLTGGVGHWFVYVPADYSPSRMWPVIYCYHGKDQQPTVWPFKDLTDGKGFIVVGMEYLDRDAGGTVEKDLPNLRRIHDAIARRLAIHEKVQFIGGFSQGGWSTSKLSEASLDTWAGIIIMGAGRAGSGSDPKVGGKPMFIGIGENDPAHPSADSAATFYKQHGADLTLEVFKGLAHAVDTKDEVLKAWLPAQANKAAGAVMKMKTDLAAAKDAEKHGKLGKAYALYLSVAQNGGDEAAPAEARAKEISDGGDKALADAQQLLTEKKYADATKALVAASATYAGAPAGDKLKAKLDEIRTDPAIKSEVEQARLDAAGEADEAAGKSAEKEGDFKRAIAIYERYVTAYPASPHLANVRQRLASLKSDKTIQAGIASRAADDDCKSWLGMAENYIKSGLTDKARPYLQKVIDTYPETQYAVRAKKDLSELP
jgi:predicted esterase